MQQGWVKLDRSVLETDLWHDVTTYRLYMYLLLKVTHQDHVTVNGIEIKKGQWIRSYRKLAQDLAYKEGRGLKEYSLKTIKKCVDKLVKSGMVTIQETEVGTLFTLLESPFYQGFQEVEKETVNGTVPEVETNGKRTVNNNKKAEESKNAKNTKNTYSNEFERFWSIYPRKVDKKQAYTKFKAALKRHPLEKILEGTERYAEYTRGKNPDYIKHASTFLNNDSFIDGYEEPQPTYQKQRGQVVSLFQQGEESKKRQKAAEESVNEETMAELQKTLGEMPF